MELTDWISAASSVASLAVAIFATFIAWTVHKGERKRTLQAKIKEQQQQANLVTAWETADRVPKDQINEVPRDALNESQRSAYDTYVYATRISRTLVNRSSQPVYDVEISADGMTEVFRLPLLPPGEQQIGMARYGVVDYSQDQLNGGTYLLNLTFRDAAGKRWVRKAEGTLVEVASNEERDAAMGSAYQELQLAIKNYTPLPKASQTETGNGTE